MSITKNLKKLLICSASLVMIAGLGSGISNVSAKRVHHPIKTHKVMRKRARHGKRANHKHAKKHSNYYAKGYKLGKENLQQHNYESVAAYEKDQPIIQTLYNTHMNKQLIRGIFKGLHAHIADNFKGFDDIAMSSTKRDLRLARKLLHQKGSSSSSYKKGVADGFRIVNPNKKYRHNKLYMKGYKLTYKIIGLSAE